VPAEGIEISSGDTAWLLVSSALVLLMTPGLAFFYGGLNRSKSVLNMMMMSFASIGLISILWLFYGFTATFGPDQPIGDTPGIIGDLTAYLGTMDLTESMAFPPFPETPIPTYVIMAFQMMFAIITVALISGSVSDRTKFAGWLVFAAGWFTLAYIPIAHMVWGGGFIGAHIGALDFAGGTAVHINAGAAALALALVIGRRIGYPRESFKPHNVPFVALGAALLWFGWFGFNAAPSHSSGHRARVHQHQVATAAALLGWISWVDQNGKPTWSVRPPARWPPGRHHSGLRLRHPGVGRGAGAPWQVSSAPGRQPQVQARLRLTPRRRRITPWVAGSARCGRHSASARWGLLTQWRRVAIGKQAIGAGIASVWSFVVALVVALIVKYTIGLRVKSEAEIEGIDVHEHKETAYDTSHSGGGSGGSGAFAQAGIGSASNGAHSVEAKPAQPAQPANV
jgi:Amt family ammonium transporter